MMTTMHPYRVVLLAAASLGLLACGHSRVVRQAPPPQAVRPAAAQAAPERVSQPKYGATAVVRPGQTVYRIATENGITALDLALWNDIPPPYTIHPGQTLRLYPRDGHAPASRPQVKPPATASTATMSASPAASAAAKPVIAGAGNATSPAATAAPTAKPAVVPTNSNLEWRWPADGAVISGFAAGDPTRQGVDIAGKAGQPVRAAADGVVVYSGSGLVGYGELVIVKHNDQWLSAYGHNRARMVNEGALVKAGQQIAEMGRSGASRDMLHFEIRYNGKPVDPQEYLPKK
ncbi:MAG TPA: peptidoglycan DD-metalloendopeptidase family protein [Thermomonas sp.]|jgi:lipoprotein NlpD|uniref:peptidoglycan DD-metalloendopeptidase family protein n=1 Tax=Thermomonas sp. TaxID=1971895 RepID=UPI002CC08B1C|nr:peptidoglycan DD-metalloendopeptidase family protein [Thermomonas sp.]HOV96029.1 peptidoglycan DD-metalloendopeptidase family protein [Thermomonas sp.]